ncbi:MAG: uL22 family ribosomal protein, partial [Candidatus Moraniibacteriota bacterium]
PSARENPLYALATNNFDLSLKSLIVKEVSVGDGLRLKRYMPKAFGQATQILRRSSKIKIILEGEKEVKPIKKAVSAPKEKKEVPKKEVKEEVKAKAE